MCEEWRHDFAAFLLHIGPKPSRDHSLDRIDVNGNYEPGNVRWASRTEQAGNQRKAVWIAAGRERLWLAEFARRNGVNYKMLHKKVHYRGLDPFEAVRQLRRRRHPQGIRRH
jgi:hypothetical protein